MKFEEALQLMREGKNARITGDDRYYFINRNNLFSVADKACEEREYSSMISFNRVDFFNSSWLFAEWEIVE
jgi:hypothetical protein